MALESTARPIDAVVFDVGGVVFVPKPDWLLDAFAAAGIPVELGGEGLFRAHYHGIQAVDRVMTSGPAIDGAFERAYLGAVVRAVGVGEEEIDRAVEVLSEAWRVPASEVWVAPVPDSAEALAAMAEAGVALAVVSNSDGTVEEKLRSSGVCQVGKGEGAEVAAVVDSHVAGVAKPDPAIFGPALEALGVDSRRAAYVGDSVHYDVGGARRAGMWPVHFDPFGLCDATDHDHVAALGAVTTIFDCGV
jgi:putative hydrolase of the HAD superfamily